MAAALRLPLLPWTHCVGPAVRDAAAGGGEGGGGNGGGEGGGNRRVGNGSGTGGDEGMVQLVEFDGVAPFVYSNLNGLMERADEEEGGVVVHAVVDPRVLAEAADAVRVANAVADSRYAHLTEKRLT